MAAKRTAYFLACLYNGLQSVHRQYRRYDKWKTHEKELSGCFAPDMQCDFGYDNAGIVFERKLN